MWALSRDALTLGSSRNSLAKKLSIIAFIGPVEDKAVGNALSRIPKVVLCGNMMRKGVVGSIMHSDVCMIPHVINPLTCAMSPIQAI